MSLSLAPSKALTAPAARRRAGGLVLLLTLVLQACAPAPASPPAHMRCTSQTVSRLYFGFDAPDGPVTDAAWRDFVQSDIAPRLASGFTVLAATGQWRGDDGRVRQEESRVLERVGDDTPAERQALAEIVARYKARFRQESVLVTQSPIRVCW